MNSILQSALFKNLIAVFIFLVFVASLGSVIADHFLHIADDPRIVTILTSGIGYAFSQIGVYQGVSSATQAAQALASPVAQVTQANTAATQANTDATLKATQ